MILPENVFINFHAHQHQPDEKEIVVQSLFLQEDFVKESSDKIFFTSGLHPWHADKLTLLEVEDRLKKLIIEKRIIAVGETGLDKTKGIDWEIQNDVFKVHVKVAEEFGLPVIIHSVKSHNEILKLRVELKAKTPWIIHLFNGSKQLAFDFIRHGFYLSMGHHIKTSNSKLSEYFAELPLDKIFLETDDFNIDIKELYSFVAQRYNISIDELKKKINSNFKYLFNVN